MVFMGLVILQPALAWKLGKEIITANPEVLMQLEGDEEVEIMWVCNKDI